LDNHILMCKINFCQHEVQSYLTVNKTSAKIFQWIYCSLSAESNRDALYLTSL